MSDPGFFACSNPDLDDLGDDFDPQPGLTWEGLRSGLDQVAERLGEWQGLPVPIEDMAIRLHDRHPMADEYRRIDDPGVEVDIIVGGPTYHDDDIEVLVNRWWSAKAQAMVYVFRRGVGADAKSFAVKQHRSPDRSMDRLSLWLTTVGASQAWRLEAEYAAREKLMGLLSEHQWRQYDLTGAFLESSPRSGVTYLFRRLRPTVALSPRWGDGKDYDSMRCLGVLCMHPCGLYDQSWAGCLTPSDDVIAHLLLMRHDEANYWGQCNVHDPSSPEAGL